ncbi:MAG TPA: hypothetical protein VMZ25_10410 [Terriglobales bacterium]|nr:hypothetical protein [Terriglobales bacterium]
MNKSRFSIGALVIAMVWLVLPSGSAQEIDPTKPYALIFGTVFGPDQRPAAFVRVKIRRVDQKKPKWELVSDRRGEFAQRFPAGKADYIVTTHVDKKYAIENKEVKVHIDNDERQDIALHLTKAETTVSKAKQTPSKD